MIILLFLTALGIWAIVGAVISVRRDGYRRCNTVEAGLRLAPRNALEMGKQWRGW
ncbi:hypothetical protein SAMN04489834_1210 [Microterricola viridarii]|uniref:Uncharacterized protein n=1 Tax=Microterricola viridarii TaxID=412690 RepID=A0A1H1R0N7_9MICO|nr:hypothetical protein SAMN04489834_1210 [Microterricola viridarii]